MLAKVFVGLTLASSALANVFITSPLESTSFTAGQEAQIMWQDDGIEPGLAEFGPAMISIYTGNAEQQTLLQEIETGVDVSQVSSVSFVPSASIGPDSNQYFIRIESLSAKDPTNPSIPALAFSSRFSLDGMTGEFSDVASSQIAAQSTAPLTRSSPITGITSDISTATAPTGSATVKTTGSASARLATSISGKPASTALTSMSMSASRASTSLSTTIKPTSVTAPLPPARTSSAPTDLASAITVPASGAVLGAQIYTGVLFTLLGALVGAMVL